MQAVGANFSECETSGCSRSVGFGLIFLFGIVPIIDLASCLLTFLLLKLGFMLSKYNPGFKELISLAILPYSITSVIFSFLTFLIYGSGEQSDLHVLAFSIVLIGLLIINAILLVLSICFVCNVNWKKAIIAAIPCMILLSAGIKIHFSYAEPYLHYLSEESTYKLAKYHLIDKFMH